jgi:hypothetical protein
MEKNDNPVMQYLYEQIALEEHLCRVIEQQISEVDEKKFGDAKALLVKTKQVLERHYAPLNKMLDQLEKDAATDRTKLASGNGAGALKLTDEQQRNKYLSRILRDDYSALNLITMSNTLLHTTALALECHSVAAIALSHLQNLASLVVKMGKLLPEVVARELHTESPKIDLAVGKLALKNTQLAWRNADD